MPMIVLLIGSMVGFGAATALFLLGMGVGYRVSVLDSVTGPPFNHLSR